MALAIANEPYDWISTAARCSQGGCDLLDYAGFLPLVPGALGRLDDVRDAAKLFGMLDELPTQLHHLITNKSSKWTGRLSDIASKYGLDLGDDWNKVSLPHLGRHPDAYHQWVLEQLELIDQIAKGDRELFLELFEKRVKLQVLEHPEMLLKAFWE